jgi:hypothetical protein
MKGFYIGFSISIIQCVYYEYQRNKRQQIFNKKLNLYLKDKEKKI